MMPSVKRRKRKTMYQILNLTIKREGQVDDSSTDSDSEDSDGANTVEGVNEENVQRYVIDGEYLLHRVNWDQKSTYVKYFKNT